LKPIVWKSTDIGMAPDSCGTQGRRLLLKKIFLPVFDTSCEIVGGETVDEAAQNLAVRLRQERVL
jgi:hypothetical protein